MKNLVIVLKFTLNKQKKEIFNINNIVKNKILLGVIHMAIYRFNSKAGNKIAKNVIEHLNYINREEKYKNKEDLFKTKTFNLPDNFENIKEFWEAALQFERLNSNMYREHVITLPKEFSNEKNQEILEKFLEKTFEKNYVYNYAIHNPNNEQPHAHVMFCERKLDGIKRDKEQFFKRYNEKNPEKGGAKKDRDLQKKEYLFTLRKNWENHLNLYLEAAGIEKVSSESLEKQMEKAIEEGDKNKAISLNRKAINYTFSDLKNGKYKLKNEKSQNIKEKYNKFKNEQKRREYNSNYKKKKQEMKYKTFEEMLEEKAKVESQILKIQKKLDEKRLTEEVHNILSKNKINTLKNTKRKLFKKMKESFESEKKIIKNLIKETDKLIDDLKEKNKDSFEEEKLKRQATLVKTLNFLSKNKSIIDNIIMDEIKKDKSDDFEKKKTYEAFMQKQNFKKDKEVYIEKIKFNNEKIKENVSQKNWNNIKKYKSDNARMRKRISILDNISRIFDRSRRSENFMNNSTEFRLDNYAYDIPSEKDLDEIIL